MTKTPTRAELLRCYTTSSKKIRLVAEHYRVSLPTAYRWIDLYNLRPRPKNVPEHAKTLHRYGMTVQQLAKLYETDTEAVLRRLRE